MNPIFIYIIKVNVAIALFYLLYRILFVRDTFFMVRRIYLLLSVVVSFAYPAIRLSESYIAHSAVSTQMLRYVLLPEFEVMPNNANIATPLWQSAGNVMLYLYIFVASMLLLRMLLQFASLMRIRKSCTRNIILGVNVYASNQSFSPFSFFDMIVINPNLHSQSEQSEILAHEQTHVKQKHSYDVVLFEMLCIVLWFNLFVWLTKREVRHNLEYLADKNVITQGFDSKSYQYHLLQLSYHTPSLFLTNKFNILPLKKRIVMMNRSKSPRILASKYLLIVPILFSLVFLSNAESFIQSASSLNLEVDTKISKNQLAPLQAAASNEAPSLETTNAAVATNNDTPIKQIVETKPLPEVVVVSYGTAATDDKKTKTKAPEKSINEKVVFQDVEQMPQFPGGDNGLFKYLAESIRYPVDAQESGIQGRVICQFVIDENGQVNDVKVVRGVDASLDAEAIRVIKAMPKWTPAIHRGKNVSVQYTLPINFRLDSGKNETAYKPLIVIDGKPMPADFDTSSIDPNKIAEVKVEKAKDSDERLALMLKYGERAAGGVIHITLKK